VEEQRKRSTGSDKPDQHGPLKGKVDLELPKYNEGLGKLFELPAEAQSNFNGVVTEVYPLRANLQKLQDFCNRYLNAAGKPQPAWFEAMAPWVLLQVCKYGKMAFRQQNVGWVSQHELAFGFPVRLFERDDHNPRKFKDWAMVYPFIYVDNPLSIALGRQVYGWGKAGMEVLPPHPDPEPHNRCLLSVDLSGGPERNAARTNGAPRFLEIFQQGSALSGNAGFASLYALFPRVLQGSMQTVSGFLGAASAFSTGLRNSIGPNDFITELQKMAAQMFGAYDYLDSYLSAAADMARDLELMKPARNYGLGRFNIITLKQFRDAEDTDQACLRALVMSHIEFSRFLDGGMLRTDLMSPDLSGGVQIKVNESGHDRVVDCLGIKSEYMDGSAHVLRSFSPFWMKADLSYGAAERQYWRTAETSWSTTEGPGPQPNKNPEPLPYIQEGSGCNQEIPGAITSEDFTYQVFALPAEKDKLIRLLDEYLKEALTGSKYEFEVRTTDKNPFKGKCYILAMFSSNFITGKDSRKELSDRVVTFALPIWCSVYRKPKWRRRALVPLYTLVEQDWDLATESEIYGQLAFKSLIAGIAPSWIEKRNIIHQVLHARTLLFPTLNEAEPARLLPIVQVDAKEPVFEISESPHLASAEREPSPEKETSQMMEAYLDLLGISTPPHRDRRIRYVALKQIRDAIHLKYSSYQALVGVTSKVEKPRSEGIEDPINVRFYCYDDRFNLAAKMGLERKRKKLLVDDLPCDLYTATSSRGVRFQGRKEQRIGENLAWSVKSGKWHPRSKDPIFFTDPE
jgi:hypothetical protein